MNNYEYLVSGGIDALVNAFSDRCACCANNQKGDCMDECESGWRKWLDMPRAESLEEIAADLERAAGVPNNIINAYFGEREYDKHNGTREMLCEIANRIRRAEE